MPGSTEPSRELDKWLAMHILDIPEWMITLDGYARLTNPETGKEYDIQELYHYSADGYHWQDIAEALRAKGWLVVCKMMPDSYAFLAGDMNAQQFRAKYVCEATYMSLQIIPAIRRRWLWRKGESAALVMALLAQDVYYAMHPRDEV